MEQIRTIRSRDVRDDFYKPHFQESAAEIVRTIIENVRRWGDDAVTEYSAAFDKITPASLRIPAEATQAALANLQANEPALYDALRYARDNALTFARRQRSYFTDFEDEIVPGVWTGQKNIPVERAGIYVPGGRFPLISTVIMTFCPAIAAGVREIALCTPPKRHPDDAAEGIPPPIRSAGQGKITFRPWTDERIMATTALCQQAAPECALEVFACGGAQAIAAMAFGTRTIRPCSIIVGPGNKFIAEAKRQISGYAGIDMVAGPTELFVIADDSANPAWVAADMLAQAEHDIDAQVALVTNSEQFARAVGLELRSQTEGIATSETALVSLARNAVIIIAESLRDAIAIANRKAPEHLELAMDPGEERDYFAANLRNYGSLFVGHTSGEVLGDYSAGINHTLPTSGAAHWTGGLSVRSFFKTVTTLRAEKADGTVRSLKAAEKIAGAEGLAAHAAAARIRLAEGPTD